MGHGPELAALCREELSRAYSGSSALVAQLFGVRASSRQHARRQPGQCFRAIGMHTHVQKEKANISESSEYNVKGLL
jgi:hypothetical protein